MSPTTNHSDYLNALTRRNGLTWLVSGLIAAGLNIVLFLLMPYLMSAVPNEKTVETLVSNINVIRIKRPESPVKRKDIKPPEPQKEKPKVQPKAAAPHTVSPKLTLPFKVNPRLPGGVNSLELPPFESGPIATVGFAGTFSVGQLDAPLTTLTRIPPVYPMRARRRGIEGSVKVGFIVDEEGNPRDITIIEAQPPDIFEDSVRRCVSGWRFKPGTVDGMQVQTRVETVIRFELD